jgi:hydroxymethylpyrimidine pyrophosphatase-like HAD family hydrolase
MQMISCYESDLLFYTGLSIGLWIASVVGMGCAVFSSRKKSYADQVEEMMFEHIVQQLRGINMAEAYEQEHEQEQEQVDSEDSDSDSEDEEQEEQEQEQEDSEESNDADNEQDIECIEETHTEYDDLPDLVEEPPAPVEPSDDTDLAPPSKRARRGRGRGRGRGHT